MSQYDLTPRVHEMTPFTDCENDELHVLVKIGATRSVVPMGPAETPMTELQALADHQECPLETATEAILLNDMFASFLSSGNWGYVIAVSGGFGADGVYHIVGAGNTGKQGVRRPRDELCTTLGRACEEFILGSTMPLEPDDMSDILFASLNICHAEVARRLIRINTGETFITPASSNEGTLDNEALWLYSSCISAVAAMKNLRWEELGTQERTEVATYYGHLLKLASELCDKVKNFGSIQFHRQIKPFYELNAIMKGLQLLRRLPLGTRIAFDWPQGPINGDRFWCQSTTRNTMIEDVINNLAIEDHELQNKMRRMWKEAVGKTQCRDTDLHAECQLHCEIYLALYILFSESNVRFHSFWVEEKKRIFTIGCSKESCAGCWDILLRLFRQDSLNHPIYMCRTRRPRGKCFATWGLTPHVETLPPSLRQAVTGRQTQMLKSLNDALKYTHQKFKWRVASLV
jgi:hypothetical protein